MIKCFKLMSSFLTTPKAYILKLFVITIIILENPVIGYPRVFNNVLVMILVVVPLLITAITEVFSIYRSHFVMIIYSSISYLMRLVFFSLVFLTTLINLDLYLEIS